MTVGNGTPDGAWMYQSGGVLVRAQLTFGSTTSVSGVVSFGLPNSFTALSDGVRTVGATYCRDDSASTEPIGTVVVASGDAVGTPYANDNNVTATNPFTWATDDIIACTVFVPQ